MSKEERAKVSNELAKRKPGTVVTDRELELADQDQTVVCVNRRVTGSHIPVRECHTRRQLTEKEKAAQAAMADGKFIGGLAPQWNDSPAPNAPTGVVPTGDSSGRR